LRAWIKNLVVSMILSVVIWGWLVSWRFGFIIVTAIFIHEYGHFYWMKKEGIKNRDMLFIPPFGAVARSMDQWPSRGAESRIALAGPASGLISLLPFLLLWLLYGSPIFAASTILICYLNLFNLLTPISILDGGRVIKSVLASIEKRLEYGFYIFSLAIIIVAFITGYLSPFFALLVFYFTWTEFRNLLSGRRKLKNLSVLILATRKNFQDPRVMGETLSGETLGSLISLRSAFLQIIGYKSIEDMEENQKNLKLMVDPPSMSIREIALSILFFILIATPYILTLFWLKNYMSITLGSVYSNF